jgi:hypothetical protein
MTNRLRLLLAWLVMAAVPLQGFAAASMLFCAAATHDVKVQSRQASVSAHHDHAGHSHAASSGTTTQWSDVLNEASHECGLCASCCHSVAITEFPSLVAPTAAPRAEMADLFAPISSWPSPVPDKPPQA